MSAVDALRTWRRPRNVSIQYRGDGSTVVVTVDEFSLTLTEDTAHAVALEREKCAALIDSEIRHLHSLIALAHVCGNSHIANMWEAQSLILTAIATAMRSGDHWKDGA